MTYNCLFTALTDAALVDETLDHAIAMAARNDAHLDVLCLGVDRTQTGYYYAGASAVVVQESLAQAEQDADRIEARVRERLKTETIRWAIDKGIAQLADIARHVAGRARFSDLTIQPRPYGEGRGAELELVIEAELFEGRVPTLVVPPGRAPDPDPRRILIGWNQSPEALTAVRAAMPVLVAADAVHVVVVDPPKHGPERSDPGGLLAQYLARHGIKVEIDVLARTLPKVSDVLLRHAKDIDADMMVTGAYSHSRFREAIFGGATRAMLEEADLPVLMAH